MNKPVDKIIRNIHLPSCKNCIHYKHRFIGNECRKFGEKNLVSGTITHIHPNVCRSDESLCGKKGNHYEKSNSIRLRLLEHKIFRPITLLIAFPAICSYSYII